MSQEYGVVTRGKGGVAIRFERIYEASPDELWAALTQPHLLAGWLAEAPEFDLHVGGKLHLRWNPDDQMRGHVTVCEPPSTLEYTWFEGAEESIVRFEILGRGDGTSELVLNHRRLRADVAEGMGAGWHLHLDGLGAALRGGREDVTSANPRWAELRARYAERVTTA